MSVGHYRNTFRNGGTGLQGRLLKKAIFCGEGENFHAPNAPLSPLLGGILAKPQLIHRDMWIPVLVLGVVGLTLISEGHPRSNGDGPLTRRTRLNRERG